ncbi:MAG TPA: SDR family oxidoreductase [Candidatus Acidoferrum sp.]|nr:SDR family oxidoreductase [Candidatus Acidoferrum sp.]
MKRKQPPVAKPDAASLNRRNFLSGIAMTAGAAAVLGQIVIPSTAAAADAPAAPAPGSAPTPGQRGPAGPPRPADYRQAGQLTDLKGKTAYITGGTTGIGLGIARAAYNAGMNLVLGYHTPRGLPAVQKLFNDDTKRILLVQHDVTDREGWAKLLTQIESTFGKLHLLVGNAGAKTLRKVSESTVEDWDNATAVNFTGIFNGVHTFIPHMLKHGEGSHIVTTSSMSGILPGSSAGNYTATKFGAVGIMEALRIELERTNIGTSAFCPGGVSTDNLFSSEQTPGAKEPAGMDPLEAGERVLNGVINNDLFILTHPEYKAGTVERMNLIAASFPEGEKAPPEDRVKYELRVLTAPIYVPELNYRKKGRKNYRATKA